MFQEPFRMRLKIETVTVFYSVCDSVSFTILGRLNEDKKCKVYSRFVSNFDYFFFEFLNLFNFLNQFLLDFFSIAVNGEMSSRFGAHHSYSGCFGRLHGLEYECFQDGCSD